MKVTVIVSLVALALGYLLGKGTSSAEPEGAELKVKNLSRETRSSDRRSGTRGMLKKGGSGFEYYLEERRSRFHKSRLHASILRLNADEIANALDLLIDKEEKILGEVFERDSGDGLQVNEEMKLLFARWYELEGAVALSWLKNQNVLLLDDCVDLEVDLIADGFERDPEMAIELYLDTVKRFGEEKLHIGHYAQMLYEIGRWSDDPLGHLERIDFDRNIRDGKGIRPTRGKIFYMQTSRLETSSYAMGLVESGRSDLAYQLKGDFGESGWTVIEKVLGGAAENVGWRELKARIDTGALPFQVDDSHQVMNNLAREDLGKATDWFLAQDLGDGQAREERIADLVSGSDLFILPDEDEFQDPFSNGRIDQKKATKWLNDLESKGEDVQKAWISLVNSALSYDDMESVEDLKNRISPENWKEIEEGVIDEAIYSDSKTILGKEVMFQRLTSNIGTGDSQVEEMGLLERAQERVAVQNEIARDQLRALLRKTQ